MAVTADHEFLFYVNAFHISCIVFFTILALTTEFLNWEFTPYDLSRLERYSSLQADYLLVKDIVSRLSRIYFLGRLSKSLKNSQSVSDSMAVHCCILYSYLYIFIFQICRRSNILGNMC